MVHTVHTFNYSKHIYLTLINDDYLHTLHYPKGYTLLILYLLFKSDYNNYANLIKAIVNNYQAASLI